VRKKRLLGYSLETNADSEVKLVSCVVSILLSINNDQIEEMLAKMEETMSESFGRKIEEFRDDVDIKMDGMTQIVSTTQNYVARSRRGNGVLKIVSRNSTVQLLEAISKDWQCSEIFISLFTLEISRQTCRVRCLIISFFILGILSSFFFLSPFSPYVKWECRRGSLPGTIKFQVESRGDEVATSSSWTGGGGLTF
jgi:hypothetical protein